MIQVTESRLSQLERPKADVVECFIVKNHALVCILNQLVNGKRRVVGFYNDV